MTFWKNIKYKLLTKGFGLYINSLHYLNAKFAANTAYTLFSVPRDGVLKSLPTFLSSSAMQKLNFNQYHIQTYEWYGTKETILLVHGWESNANRWQGVIQYLKKLDYRVIALDAPGQGLSSGKELNAVLYSKFVNEVCNHFKPQFIIGHSLGGMTMLYYLATYQPNFIKKAISLGAPNRFLRITENYKQLISLSNKSYQGFLNEFSKRFSMKPENFNSSSFIDSIKIPLGIIHDKTDTVVPYSDAVEIISKHNYIPLYTTENLGHSLYDEIVNQQIIHFLENNCFKS
ncbi:alpha/beta hydrolase [Myroides sp. JBRI-B21084]|uniref:alpha/beta fold hydrolase n=1 Tax=Myroides sp. JBRI-B21084 TaxID=3119977 RepID=UPI0026E1BCC1|nr:alpha/beta hydrolase [Paenimyroides cloacae]WKW47347.1 alpha/beta hydrolase [Paenimyroides cloacae]